MKTLVTFEQTGEQHGQPISFDPRAVVLLVQKPYGCGGYLVAVYLAGTGMDGRTLSVDVLGTHREVLAAVEKAIAAEDRLGLPAATEDDK